VRVWQGKKTYMRRPPRREKLKEGHIDFIASQGPSSSSTVGHILPVYRDYLSWPPWAAPECAPYQETLGEVHVLKGL